MSITWGVVAQFPEPGAHVSNAQPSMDILQSKTVLKMSLLLSSSDIQSTPSTADTLGTSSNCLP